jgi:hypothetical protein
MARKVNSLFSGVPECLESALERIAHPKLRAVAAAVWHLAHLRSRKAARRVVESLAGALGDAAVEYVRRYLMPLRRRIVAIGVSESYVIAHIKRAREEFVFGVDGDTDEVFVVSRNAWRAARIDMWRCGETHIVVHCDDSVKGEVFGYDYDVTGMTAAISLRERGPVTVTYRVQGEITVRVSDIHALTRNDTVRGEVARYLRYVAFDRILAVLRDHGFAPEVLWRHRFSTRLENDTIRVLGIDDMDGVKRVVRLLDGVFKLERCEERPLTPRGTEMLLCSAALQTAYGTARIELAASAVMLWHARYPAMYVVVGTIDSEAPHNIASDIVNGLLAAERTDVTTRVGRHTIELKRAIPVSLTYTPRERFYVLDPAVISIALPRHYVVFPESRMIVQHPEHGVRELSFDGTYVTSLGTTRVGELHLSRVNRLALRRLAPSHDATVS